jgi:hypothetical protein
MERTIRRPRKLEVQEASDRGRNHGPAQEV